VSTLVAFIGLPFLLVAIL